ncbi:sensor histidine kinase [Nocardioides marmoribigeumensis]|nr:ATP-binding protein [Nocardioides marmoribigeumensis]
MPGTKSHCYVAEVMAVIPAAGRRTPHTTAHLLVAGAVTVVALVLLSPLSLSVRSATTGIALVVLAVALAHGTWRNARACTGTRRLAWRLFTAAAASAIIGNGWAAAVGADPVSSPSVVSDCWIALGLALSVGGLLALRASGVRSAEKALLVLDGLVAGSAVLLITTIAVYSQVLDSLSGPWLHQVMTLTFPFLDVVMVTVAALLLTENRTQPVLLGLIGGGFALYAIGDLAFAARTAAGSSSFGTPWDLAWIAGYGMFLVAVWRPDATVTPPVTQTVRTPVRRTVLVFGLLAGALAVEVTTSGPGLDVVRQPLWVLLAAAVGARQTLLTADNAGLRAGLERRVQEQTADLRRMARQTEALVTSVADGIYGVGHDGLVSFVNPAAAATLGYSVEDLLGRDPHDTFHAPQADGTPYPKETCYVAQAMQDNATVSAEADRYLRADGTVIPVEVTASPLRDEAGVRGAVVAFRDTTERHEVERMKHEFLSVVSHELRTPLTSIRGSLGLLSGGGILELNPAAERMLTIAVDGTERLGRLINDILDIERIESGRLSMELSSYAAAELVQRCLDELAGLTASSGVVVRAAQVGGWVLADADRVVQCLANLVGNAVKFSPAGAEVEVSAGPDPADPSRVLFAVADHGRGIPEDKLETVFQPFEQVDSSDSRDHGGTGLGLAITRQIVEAHGGRVWATSVLGVGTTMRFTLTRTTPRPHPPTPTGEPHDRTTSPRSRA